MCRKSNFLWQKLHHDNIPRQQKVSYDLKHVGDMAPKLARHRNGSHDALFIIQSSGSVESSPCFAQMYCACDKLDLYVQGL